MLTRRALALTEALPQIRRSEIVRRLLVERSGVLEAPRARVPLREGAEEAVHRRERRLRLRRELAQQLGRGLVFARHPAHRLVFGETVRPSDACLQQDADSQEILVQVPLRGDGGTLQEDRGVCCILVTARSVRQASQCDQRDAQHCRLPRPSGHVYAQTLARRARLSMASACLFAKVCGVQRHVRAETLAFSCSRRRRSLMSLASAPASSSSPSIAWSSSSSTSLLDGAPSVPVSVSVSSCSGLWLMAAGIAAEGNWWIESAGDRVVVPGRECIPQMAWGHLCPAQAVFLHTSSRFTTPLSGHLICAACARLLCVRWQLSASCTMPSAYSLSAEAYLKALLHGIKYPHGAANGLLVGRVTGDTANKEVEIVDAVPLQVPARRKRAGTEPRHALSSHGLPPRSRAAP